MSSSTKKTSDNPMKSPLFSTVAIVASCVGFVAIGAFQALYGPAIPTFLKKFDISTSGAGFALSAHFAGALAGVLVFHRLHGHIGNRSLLRGSYGLMAAGSLLFAITSNWTLALVGAFVVGLGFGGIDYGLNQLFSVGFGRRSAAMLNLLNAYFGVGAIVGPALIGWLGPRNYPWIFGGLGLISVLLMLSLGGVRQEKPERSTQEHATAGGRRALVLVASFVAIYVFHVAIETGVGGWEPTHLETIGYSVTAAATATSVYWLSLTVGRFLVIPLSLRFSAQSIVIVSCVGMAVCLVLATIPVLALYAYVGVGLFIAPIFPTALPWLNRAVPTIGSASAYVIAASMIGGVAFPPLLGRAIELSGVRTVPLLLFGLAVICVLISVWLARATGSAVEDQFVRSER
jgi:FHS family glucose/mannose:H+ symporter-like MFS transporter